MTRRMTPARFEKLEALHLLIEENDLAIIEANVRLNIIDTLMARFSNRLMHIKDKPDYDLMIRALPDLMQHKSRTESQLYNDRNNRMVFFSESQKIAQEMGIWKEPSKPSQLKK